MSDLGPEARAIVAAARRGATGGPTAAQVDRLRERIDGAIGPCSGGGRGRGGGGSTGGVAMGGAATIVAVAAIALFSWRASTHAPEADRAAMSAPPQPREVAIAVATPSAAESAPPPVAVEALPRVKAPTRAVATKKAATPRVAERASERESDVTLVRAAYEALRAGDAVRSLALLDEHARRFPPSALTEEREHTRVLALCAAGRSDEARAAREAFRAAHPASAPPEECGAR